MNRMNIETFLVEDALGTVPRQLTLYDQKGKQAMRGWLIPIRFSVAPFRN